MPQPRQHTDSRALAILLFGALCISFAAILVKAIGENRLGPTVIGFWRTLFGSVIFFAMALFERKPLGLPRRMFLWAILAGVCFFGDLWFWHRSIFYTGAGMATILVTTQVFFGAVLGHFAFREKLHARFFFAAVGGVIGVALLIGVFSQDIHMTGTYLLGVVFGLATGLFYASYLSTLKQASQEHLKFGTLTLMGWTSLFTALFLGVAGAVEGEAFLPPDKSTWLFLLLLGLVPQALGWRAITRALPRIENHRAALALLLQPILATVWGVLIFGEVLSALQIVGAVITLGCIYVGSVRD